MNMRPFSHTHPHRSENRTQKPSVWAADSSASAIGNHNRSYRDTTKGALIKSLAGPGTKQATATEYFHFHVSYL